MVVGGSGGGGGGVSPLALSRAASPTLSLSLPTHTHTHNQHTHYNYCQGSLRRESRLFGQVFKLAAPPAASIVSVLVILGDGGSRNHQRSVRRWLRVEIPSIWDQLLVPISLFHIFLLQAHLHFINVSECTAVHGAASRRGPRGGRWSGLTPDS